MRFGGFGKVSLACVLAASAVVVSPQSAGADGLPDPTFGVNGVVVDAGVLNGGALPRISNVIDDNEGRLLVAGHYWAAQSGSPSTGLTPVPPITQFVARYNRSGQLDPTFGSGGVVRGILLGGAAPEIGLAMLPDGSILPTGWPAPIVPLPQPLPPPPTLPPGSPVSPPPTEFRRITDSGQVIGGLSVPTGASRPVEFPDGRVAFALPTFVAVAGRVAVVQVVRPDGTRDLSFDGTVDSALAPEATLAPEGTDTIVVGAGGSLLVALRISSTECRVVKFGPSGGVDSSFGAQGSITVPTLAARCNLIGDADGAGLLQTSMPNQYLEVTSRLTSSGVVTPVPWPFVGPAVVEGWGRTIGVVASGPTQIGAAFGDGTPDVDFGNAGLVQFPGQFRGLRVLDHGGVIAYGLNNAGNAIVLQRLDTFFGTSPEPPVLPTAKFVPVPPQRVLDTRLGLGAPVGKVAAGGTLNLTLGGIANVPTTGVVAVALNVTATESAGPGFVTVYPTGRSRPVVSSLNLERADQTVANQVTARMGAGGRVSLFTLSTTHLVADVAGYYVEADIAAEGRFVSVPPERLLDTRLGIGATAGVVAAGNQIRLQIRGVAPVPSSGISAVVLNLTGTEAVSPGFVTAWPSGNIMPVVSNLNLETGDTRANLVVVPLGSDGAVSLFSSGGTHLVADIAGWFTDSTADQDTAGLFVPLDSPVRMLDTRLQRSTPLTVGESFRLRIGSTMTVPTFGYADAAVANVTLTESRGPGFLTLWPSGLVQPVVSNLNATRPAQTVPNAAVIKLGDDVVRGYLSGGAHVIIDVTGWYTAY